MKEITENWGASPLHGIFFETVKRRSYYRGSADNTTCGREGVLLCSCYLSRCESVNAKWLTTPKETFNNSKRN